MRSPRSTPAFRSSVVVRGYRERYRERLLSVHERRCYERVCLEERCTPGLETSRKLSDSRASNIAAPVCMVCESARCFLVYILCAFGSRNSKLPDQEKRVFYRSIRLDLLVPYNRQKLKFKQCLLHYILISTKPLILCGFGIYFYLKIKYFGQSLMLVTVNLSSSSF